MLPILTQQLHIKKEAYPLKDDDFGTYEFIGSIPEMVAQWASHQLSAFELILDLISDNGVTHFDISTLLLLYIGGHDHADCKDLCALGRLLRLGANANGPEGAFVSPIQIAVVYWDLVGMDILLNAGADPSALGQNGHGWAPNSPMKRFNHLHGASALHIIKHYDCIHGKNGKNALGLDETVRKKIEARLLELGAADIGPEG